jgi:hypothetical protein
MSQLLRREVRDCSGNWRFPLLGFAGCGASREPK